MCINVTLVEPSEDQGAKRGNEVADSDVLALSKDCIQLAHG